MDNPKTSVSTLILKYCGLSIKLQLLSIILVGTNANGASTLISEPQPPALAQYSTIVSESEKIEIDQVDTVSGQFRVDESGAATYSIPITTPLSTAGVAPSVSVNYNSFAGYGLLGRGWSLNAGSSISRCRQTLLQDTIMQPITWGSVDRFCLDGQRLLVQDGATYGAPGSTYKTELDSLVIVTAEGGSLGHPDYFKVTGKDGSITWYGEVGASDTEQNAIKYDGTEYPNKTLSWAISRFEDNIGNPIKYQYEDEINYHRLSTIDYSYGSHSVGSMRIRFNYEDEETIANTYYVGGYQFKSSGRLNTIEVVNNLSGHILRTYDFDYQNNYLKTVTECVENRCLPETTFDYATNAKSTKSSKNYSLGGDKMVSYQIFDVNGDGRQGLLWVEQKGTKQNVMHMSGEDSDGNVTSELVASLTASPLNPLEEVLLKVLDYNADSRQDVVIYNSKAPAGQRWRIYLATPNLSGEWALSATNTYLPTASLSIEFADFNGDGLADLFYTDGGSSLKIHYLTRNESQSVTSSQFYKFESQARTITVPGPSLRITDIMPAGDFNGDGRTDLIVDVENSNITNTEADRYLSWTRRKTAYIFDGNRLTHFYSLAVDQSYKPIDINGDGLSDLVYSKGNFTGSNPITDNWYFQLGMGKGFGAAKLIKNNSQEKDPKFVDYNGDGYVDFLWSTSTDLYVRLWNPIEQIFYNQDTIIGALFYPYTRENSNSTLDNYPHSILDFDGDGVWDVVFHGKAPLDSSSSVVVKLRNGGVNEGRMETITNGVGKKTEIQYSPLNYSNHYTSIQAVDGSISSSDSCIPGSSTPDGNPICHAVVSANQYYSQLNAPFSAYLGKTLGTINTAPILEIVSPAPIVTIVNTSMPTAADPDNMSGTAYYYHQARVQAGGRGSLGFKKLTTIDLQSGINTTTTYRQDWPFIGQPESTIVSSPKGVKLSESTSESTIYGYKGLSSSFWASRVEQARDQGTVALGALLTFVSSQSEKTFNLAENGESIGSLLSESQSKTDQDQYGNATSIITTTRQGTTTVGMVTTTNDYGADEWSKRYGRLMQTTVRKQRFGNYVAGNLDITKSVEFTYYGLNGSCTNETSADFEGMLCSEKVDSNTGQALTTEHYYDQFGNPTFTKSTAADGEVRLSKYSEYDSYGRYIDKIYDVFDSRITITHSTPSSVYNNAARGDIVKTSQVNSRDRYGNALQTTSTLDGKGSGNTLTATAATTDFGKLFFSADSTGAYNAILSSLASNSRCPSSTVFYTAKIQSGGGKSYECFDLLGRTIRKFTPGFNSGVWVYQDTEYNNLGQVRRSSQPYIAGESIYWNEFEYDLLGRLTVTTQTINGESAVSHVSYDGFLTSFTNPKLQTRTELRNAFGDIVASGNSLGNATYKFNALGNLVDMIDPSNNTTHIEYDDLGRKVSMDDPDKGFWLYKYNAYGEIICQQDAIGQSTVNHYDFRGRLIRSTDHYSGGNCSNLNGLGAVEQERLWTYDINNNGLGKLAIISNTYPYYYQNQEYDTLGRPSVTTINISEGLGQGKYYSKMRYDHLGRDMIQYDFARSDSVFDKNAILMTYNARGYLSKYQDAYSGLIYYETKEMDAFGNVTESLLGNGVEQSNEYYKDTGLADRFTTNHIMSGNILVNKVYWDSVGNVDYREVTRLGVKHREDFNYDELNRLKNYSVDNQQAIAVTYDKIGNITSKSDVQNGAIYDYSSNSAGPHAVNKIGSINYSYNGNGSLLNDGRGRVFTYFTFDKVKTVKQDNRKVYYSYDASRNRYMRIDEDVTTGYKDYTYYLGSVEKIHSSDGKVTWKRNIGGVAQITQTVSGNSVLSERTSYFHKDQLGSINTITDEAGIVIEELNFDPWGGRRSNALSNSSRTQVLSEWWRKSDKTTLRGFTGHEMVDGVDIIHMNGRIYDAHIGRFLQADSIIQEPTFIASLNRYTYVFNNPLNATDPSGHTVNKVFRGFIRNVSDIFGPELTYFAGSFCFGYLGGSVGAAYWDYQFNRAMGVSSSQAFRSAAITFATATISYKIGNNTSLTGSQRVFAHSVVGGLAAEAQGGEFARGFVAAGITKSFSAAGGMDLISGSGPGSVFLRTTLAAMIGGTVSEITGGKFSNGARTAALQHLFNYETTKVAEDAQKGGMVIAANGPKWGSNPFGHTAMAFDGEGVYSYGTPDPDGGSFSEYVLEHAGERDSIYFVLNTSPEQNQKMIEAFISYKSSTSYDKIAHNCATVVGAALQAGYSSGYISDYLSSKTSIAPNTILNMMFRADSSVNFQVINVPKGTTTVPESLRRFDP